MANHSDCVFAGYYVNNEDPENPTTLTGPTPDENIVPAPKTIALKDLGRVTRDIEDKKVIVTRYPISWD